MVEDGTVVLFAVIPPAHFALSATITATIITVVVAIVVSFRCLLFFIMVLLLLLLSLLLLRLLLVSLLVFVVLCSTTIILPTRSLSDKLLNVEGVDDSIIGIHIHITTITSSTTTEMFRSG